MCKLDIAIAGCGPAGLAAAQLLHRDGNRVTMFERFDRLGPDDTATGLADGGADAPLLTVVLRD